MGLNRHGKSLEALIGLLPYLEALIGLLPYLPNSTGMPYNPVFGQVSRWIYLTIWYVQVYLHSKLVRAPWYCSIDPLRELCVPAHQALIMGLNRHGKSLEALIGLPPYLPNSAGMP